MCQWTRVERTEALCIWASTTQPEGLSSLKYMSLKAMTCLCYRGTDTPPSCPHSGTLHLRLPLTREVLGSFSCRGPTNIFRYSSQSMKTNSSPQNPHPLSSHRSSFYSTDLLLTRSVANSATFEMKSWLLNRCMLTFLWSIPAPLNYFTENLQWDVSVAKHLFRTHKISCALNKHQLMRLHEMNLHSHI
jgi:hypothetical protein